MRNRQYDDAIKAIEQDIKGKSDEEAAREHLLLAECYYLTKDYEKARPYYSKAMRNAATDKEKIIAEFRLACVAYRLKDYATAGSRIESFLKSHPGDSHMGRLLVYQMAILAAKGKESEAELVRIHSRLQQNIRQHDYATVAEASEILCDFYREAGRLEKMADLYRPMMHNSQDEIVKLQKSGQHVPEEYVKTHDNAALQLGLIALEKKQYNEAITNLENVRYDADMKVRARLLLGCVAYEKGDFAAVSAYMGEKSVLENLPRGAIKSDMYLLLGLAEKARSDGSAAKVEEYLRNVGKDSKGYTQAQSALGDIYFEKGLVSEAMAAYGNAMASSEPAPGAMVKLAKIYIRQADGISAERAAPLNEKAAALIGQILSKYPRTAAGEEARQLAQKLVEKGISVAAKGEDLVAAWEKTSREKPGTFEGANTLLSLMRFHFSATVDEKKKVTKAPNYVACASACDRLLDEKVYSGAGFADGSWQATRGEARYYRAVCELASVTRDFEGNRAGTALPQALPQYLSTASTADAIKYFRLADSLVDKKRQDLVRGIKLGLLEAMFKSEVKEDGEQAEKLFESVRNTYENDEAFARLEEHLGEWLKKRGRLPEAARHLAMAGEKVKEAQSEKALRLLYNAGVLYSQAAAAAQQKKQSADFHYAIYIYPKELIERRDDLLGSYAPFSRKIDVAWPRRGYDKKVVARCAADDLAAVEDPVRLEHEEGA